VTGGSARRQIGSASAVLALGLVAWNAGNFAFFIIAGHVLGPERYGLVAALLAIVVAAFIPLSAFQPLAARPFAVGEPDAGPLVRRAVGWALAGGAAAVLTAGTAATLAALAGAGLPAGELWLTLASVVPIAPMFLSLGALQGASRFWAITATLTFWGLSRPLALLVLAPLVDGVAATLLANLVGTVAAFAVAHRFARAQLAAGTPPAPGRLRELRRALVGPLLGMSGVAVLFNVDVIVVKAVVPDVEAGYFGAVATLAKAGVVLVPQVLGIALLPQVARRAARGAPVAGFTLLIAGGTVAAGAAGIAVAGLLSDRILAVYGSDFRPGAWMLAPAIAALTPLAVVFGLVNLQIARADDRFPRALGALALLTVATLAAAGRSVEEVLLIEAAAGLLAVVLHEWLHRGDGSGLLAGARVAIGRVRRQSPQAEA
jgi:O-antigen/teichoic acid export membrane protein